MRSFVVVVLILLSFGAVAQKKKKDKDKEPTPTQQPAPQQQPTQQPAATQPTEPATTASDSVPTASMILTEHFLRKYATAIRWNDVEVAKSALYDIIVENPGNDSLISSMAYQYYEEQRYASALLIAQDLLQVKPKNQEYMEIAASAAQQVGAYDKSLQFYESLYLLNSNIRTLYQIAFLQFNLKRYAECTNSINILLSKQEGTTEKVVFNDAKGNPKEYPMKVSVLNLKGLLALSQNDKVGAQKAFNDALAIAPDFLPVKENMAKAK